MTPTAVNNPLTRTDNYGSAVDFFAGLGASTPNTFADICQQQMSGPTDDGAVPPASSSPSNPNPVPGTTSSAQPKTNVAKSGQKNSSCEDAAQGILLAIPVPIAVLPALDVPAPTQQESGVQGTGGVSNPDSICSAASGAGSSFQLAQPNAGPSPMPDVSTGMEPALGGGIPSGAAPFNPLTSANFDAEPLSGGADPALAAQSAASNNSMPSPVYPDTPTRIVGTTAQRSEAELSPARQGPDSLNGDEPMVKPEHPNEYTVKEQSQPSTSDLTFGNWTATEKISPAATESTTEVVSADSSAAQMRIAATPAGEGAEQKQASADALNDSSAPAPNATTAAAPVKVLKNTPRSRSHGSGPPDGLTNAAGAPSSSTEGPLANAVSSTVQNLQEIAVPVLPMHQRIVSAQVDPSASAPTGKQKPLTNARPSTVESGNSLFPAFQNSPSRKADDTSEPSIDGTTSPVQRKDPTHVAMPNASSASAPTVMIPFASHDPKSAGLPAADSSASKLNASDGSVPADAAMTQAAALRTAPTSPASPVQLAQIVNKATQSEMRIGLNTPAFGSVEVRTVVHASDVGVVIGSEKGDLRSLLANDLPGIADTLQQQNLRLTQVSFQQPGFASTSSFSSGGDAQSHSFAPRTNPGAPLLMNAASDDSGQSSEPSFATIRHNTRGLSVLA